MKIYIDEQIFGILAIIRDVDTGDELVFQGNDDYCELLNLFPTAFFHHFSLRTASRRSKLKNVCLNNGATIEVDDSYSELFRPEED